MHFNELRLYHNYVIDGDEYELVEIGAPHTVNGDKYHFPALPGDQPEWGVATLERGDETLVVPLLTFAKHAVPAPL